MKSTTALKIISIPSIIICFTVFFFQDFYINEIMRNFDKITQQKLAFFINICTVLGLNISIIILYASGIDNKSATKMLQGVGLTFLLTTIMLFITEFTTPLSIPHYILFMVLIFSVFSFTIANQNSD